MRLDGKTKTTERQGMAQAFNTEDYSVFLISTRAGGTGFNIAGANRVIIYDFTFNPAHEEQAVGRAYRIGQQKPVFVYRFVVGGTFEGVVYQKTVFKTQLAYRAIEKKNISRKAQKTTDFLFEPTAVAAESLDDHVGKDPNVLDKIIAPATQHASREDFPIASIETTEVLQQEAKEEELNSDEEKAVEDELRREKMRRERPEEYNRKYSYMPPPPSQNSHPVATPGPATQPPPQPSSRFSVPTRPVVANEAERTAKIQAVARATGHADVGKIRDALKSVAWRVNDAVQFLRTAGNAPQSTSTPAERSAAAVAAARVAQPEPSKAAGPGPQLTPTPNANSKVTSPVETGTSHSAFERKRRDELHTPSQPTTAQSPTKDRLEPPITLSSVAQSLDVRETSAARGSRDAAGNDSSIPVSPKKEGMQRKDTLGSSVPPRTPQEQFVRATRSETDPVISGRQAHNRVPPSTAPTNRSVDTERQTRPLSTAPSSKTNASVIDLTSDNDDDAPPPIKRRQIKRFTVSGGGQNKSDGAFDKKPTIPNRSSSSVFQADGAGEASVSASREESPPFSSQGFVKPRTLPPRTKQAYPKVLREENGLFDLSHVSDGSSTS